MDCGWLSDSKLQEWREHPVTLVLEAALRASVDRQRAAATSAFWAGSPWPEGERLSLLRMQSLVEDLFEASADDVKAAMERMTDAEPKRDNAG